MITIQLEPGEPTSTPWEIYADAVAALGRGLEGRVLKTDVCNEVEGLPGPGGLMAHLPPECQVSLVDTDGRAVDRLRAKLGASPEWRGRNLDVRQADVCLLPFETGYFDAVIDCSTLDHVECYPTALAEYHRVLKPHGRLLLFCWATDGREPLYKSYSQWYFPSSDVTAHVAGLFQGIFAEIRHSREWHGGMGPHTFMLKFLGERKAAV